MPSHENLKSSTPPMYTKKNLWAVCILTLAICVAGTSTTLLFVMNKKNQETIKKLYLAESQLLQLTKANAIYQTELAMNKQVLSDCSAKNQNTDGLKETVNSTNIQLVELKGQLDQCETVLNERERQSQPASAPKTE